ncbi:ABC transporter permease [Phosphitispora sp. TUW77]|uniref:ABC transporter permease n=1 Tax=Phosphitispora sp. TUW77 TaxID=3152361 RepID=UPI003AB70855
MLKFFKDGINYFIAFVIIISLNFLLPRLMPGDPLTAIYGEEALIQMSPEFKSQLIQRLALDQSLWEQFTSYLLSLVKGNLGYSYYYNAPVSDVIMGALPWTLLLVGTAIIMSTIIGIIIGLESGWRRGKKTDKVLLAGIMFLDGFPDFFLGMVMLIVFGVILGLFPLAGAVTPYAGYSGMVLVLDVLKHLVLPAASLTMVNVTGAYLLTRNAMIAVLGEAYIFTAKAKGLNDAAIRYRHAGRNSILPVITHTGMQVGRLVTGALFIETVFSYPGLGLLIQRGLQTRDYPVLQGVFFVITVFVLIANFSVDILYKKLDPRLEPCTLTTGKKLNPTI